MVRPANSEPHEELCPACGAAFRLADRRKRVQCPHCMEVVELGSKKTATRASASGARETADLQRRLARLDTLEARTEALEHELAEIRSAPRPVARPALDAVPEPGPKLIWHEPPFRDSGGNVDEIPAGQRAAVVANLRAIGPRRIEIQACAGAAARAAQFHEIFEEAKWTVSPVVQAAGRGHPLALVTPSGSTSREMAELFMALAAAGCTPVSQIDRALQGCDPILRVGTPAMP